MKTPRLATLVLALLAACASHAQYNSGAQPPQGGTPYPVMPQGSVQPQPLPMPSQMPPQGQMPQDAQSQPPPPPPGSAPPPGPSLAPIPMAPVAEWREVFVDRGLRVYLSEQTLRRQGRLVEAWTLWTLDQPRSIEGKAVRSSREMIYVDCNGRRSALRQAVYYPEAYGAGKPFDDIQYVVPDNRLAFEDAPPDSPGRAILQAVCRRR